MFVRKLYISLCLLFGASLTGCQSSPHLNSGIQPGFEAVNPAAIIAVPVFVIPDVASETASVDPSVLITEKFIPVLENKIIDSFDGQPNINGYPFAAVKKAIDYTPPNLFGKENIAAVSKDSSGISFTQNLKAPENAKAKIWDSLNASIQNVSNRFSSRNIKTRLLITPNCLARKNFVEFYSYCLSKEPDWLDGLNRLSARVLNADSALLTVVTNLQNHVNKGQYEITAGISVLLVDTNNGELIWGNTKTETLKNADDQKAFPKWESLLNNILTPDFWSRFPGRIGKNQLIMDQNTEGK